MIQLTLMCYQGYTLALDVSTRMRLICTHRSTGKLLWRRAGQFLQDLSAILIDNLEISCKRGG